MHIRSRLRNKDFSIISNNCWGGSIYEDLNLPYRTPTVGLFFFSACYINFLNDLERNLQLPLTFIKVSKYQKGNYLRAINTYPIGLIDGHIEVHFLHYKSEEDAKIKWKKRAERVNFDNLFYSFSDNEEHTLEQIQAFDNFKVPKVYFTSKKVPGIKSSVHIKEREMSGDVGNLYDNRWVHRKYFNTVKWLNSGNQG